MCFHFRMGTKGNLISFAMNRNDWLRGAMRTANNLQRQFPSDNGFHLAAKKFHFCGKMGRKTRSKGQINVSRDSWRKWRRETTTKSTAASVQSNSRSIQRFLLVSLHSFASNAVHSPQFLRRAVNVSYSQKLLTYEFTSALIPHTRSRPFECFPSFSSSFPLLCLPRFVLQLPRIHRNIENEIKASEGGKIGADIK